MSKSYTPYVAAFVIAGSAMLGNCGNSVTPSLGDKQQDRPAGIEQVLQESACDRAKFARESLISELNGLESSDRWVINLVDSGKIKPATAEYFFRKYKWERIDNLYGAMKTEAKHCYSELIAGAEKQEKKQ